MCKPHSFSSFYFCISKIASFKLTQVCRYNHHHCTQSHLSYKSHFLLGKRCSLRANNLCTALVWICRCTRILSLAIICMPSPPNVLGNNYDFNEDSTGYIRDHSLLGLLSICFRDKIKSASFNRSKNTLGTAHGFGRLMLRAIASGASAKNCSA